MAVLRDFRFNPLREAQRFALSLNKTPCGGGVNSIFHAG
jgi:hypothetical protein